MKEILAAQSGQGHHNEPPPVTSRREQIAPLYGRYLSYVVNLELGEVIHERKYE